MNWHEVKKAGISLLKQAFIHEALTVNERFSIPNVGRRLKRHAKNNWKKYLLFLVAFVAVSVAYHFSRELARSVEHLRTQVADALEESKKAFG